MAKPKTVRNATTIYFHRKKKISKDCHNIFLIKISKTNFSFAIESADVGETLIVFAKSRNRNRQLRLTNSEKQRRILKGMLEEKIRKVVRTVFCCI
jgi:hypothetical protein